RFVSAQKIRVWRGCPQPLPHAVSTPLQDKSRRGLPRFTWREPGGAGGTSPVDPYLLRAAEARNQDLVARERAESGMRVSVVHGGSAPGPARRVCPLGGVELADEGGEARIVERGLEGRVELGAVADAVVALVELRPERLPRCGHGKVVEGLVADEIGHALP